MSRINSSARTERPLGTSAASPALPVKVCAIVSLSTTRATAPNGPHSRARPLSLVTRCRLSARVAATSLSARGRKWTAQVVTEFGELDGEAVAFAAPYYYVVGSHGCSRKKGEFRASSFILARLSDDQQGGVETTFRLTDVLRHASTVSAYFGKDLNGDNGLNIEGLAVVGTNSSSACVAHPLTAGPSSCGRISARCSRKVTDPARRPPRRFRSPCQRARASGI